MGVVAGVAVAVVADALAFSGLPAMTEAWAGPAPVLVPSSTTSTTPKPSSRPTTASPTPTKTPTKSATTGQVSLTADLKRGIVLIDAALDGSSSSAGTGMLLTSGGQVLTNYHVVRSSVSITVTIADTRNKYAATLVGRDAVHDVALLQLKDASGMPTISVDNDAVEVGDPVVAAGNAAGQGYLTAFAGKIVARDQHIRVRGASSSDPQEDLQGLLETDAHAEPGDSGGPLFDAEAEVLGMTTAGSTSGGVGSAYAVPIASALGIVDKIRAGNEGDTVVIGPKASLGINAANDSGNGVKVTKVVAGSAAATSGLKSGDYVTGLGGRDVTDIASLMTALDRFQPGESVRLEWRTASGTKSADIVLDTSRYN